MCSLTVLVIVIAEILLTFVANIMLIAADFISINVTIVKIISINSHSSKFGLLMKV
jgi:hypothetical protein